MYDKVRVYFKDGTSTIIYVPEDESITDYIIEVCENNGWFIDDVINYSILSTN